MKKNYRLKDSKIYPNINHGERRSMQRRVPQSKSFLKVPKYRKLVTAVVIVVQKNECPLLP